MANDQRIRKCTNLAKHRLSTDPTKEVIFLKIGYADYFFYFRIGFPTSKTAENYRNIFGTMKTKLAVPERTCVPKCRLSQLFREGFVTILGKSGDLQQRLLVITGGCFLDGAHE